MKKNTKLIITIIVILAIVVLALLILNKPSSEVTKEFAQCLGNNSILYVQLGCHACKIQEDMFGDTYQYLTTIDCFYERDKCSGIEFTPTWVIKEESYTGIQSIEKLKELTGC